MKTSNKLLLGLFIVVVLGMIFANIRLKNVIETTPGLESQTSNNKSFFSFKMTKSSSNTISKTDTLQGDFSYGLFADQTKVLLSIDGNTSYDQLNQYKIDLKRLNIDLNIKKVEFADNGKMIKLEIAVDCNDGFKGTVKQVLRNNNRIGFYRIYDESAPSAFGMSAMPLE
ncbi:MAG: hypothetical protein PHS59_07870 [Paludibacter sp.]|nr:hypothetical protein [Paludibacter sp.]